MNNNAYDIVLLILETVSTPKCWIYNDGKYGIMQQTVDSQVEEKPARWGPWLQPISINVQRTIVIHESDSN